MAHYYTDEKNVQVVLALLKEHGIRKVIVSPGATNVTFVASLQVDPYFEIYSSVDERSAAYMACGLAAESGEAVVLSCTGATASRNYLPGLTEAFYRKLPVLAITSTQNIAKVGHHIAQVIDRSVHPNDAIKFSVTLPVVKDEDDLWDCEIKVKKAIIELTRNGGGPVHINLPTTYCKSFNTKELPKIRVLHHVSSYSDLPEMPNGKTAIFIGTHAIFTKQQTESIDLFCASNDAVVFCDHTSGYKGKYRVLYSLAAGQLLNDISDTQPDLLIHIGEVSGDSYSLRIAGKQVWRVSEDGEIRDTFRKLSYIFQMPEQFFFNYYSNGKSESQTSYLNKCNDHLSELYKKIPDLPFSNIWMASQMAHKIPEGSTIHFGILNSLRSWNFFELPVSVNSSANVGGFGIDGGVSSLIGASLNNKDKLYFGIIGDLAFFYDMNVLGNRHLGNNVRILLVNNGKGTEFRLFSHLASQHGEDVDKFIAAAGHFGNKSKTLVKNFSQDIGFEYICASNKDEFEKVYYTFLVSEISDRPILFEVFTNSEDESIALDTIINIEETVREKAKYFAKQILGESGVKVIKKVLKR